MSKVTMPGPLVEGGIYHHELKIMYRGMVHFTAEQMESYAAAKVREALEEAAKVCDTYFNEITEPRSNPYYDGALDAADILEQRIRALIPATPA